MEGHAAHGFRLGKGKPVIRIACVGGGGGNAINRMVDAKLQGVEFISINTDMQDIVRSKADQTIALADEESRGLGAGADPERGAMKLIQGAMSPEAQIITGMAMDDFLGGDMKATVITTGF